jgi:hypothetical protein
MAIVLFGSLIIGADSVYKKKYRKMVLPEVEIPMKRLLKL